MLRKKKKRGKGEKASHLVRTRLETTVVGGEKRKKGKRKKKRGRLPSSPVPFRCRPYRAKKGKVYTLLPTKHDPGCHHNNIKTEGQSWSRQKGKGRLKKVVFLFFPFPSMVPFLSL